MFSPPAEQTHPSRKSKTKKVAASVENTFKNRCFKSSEVFHRMNYLAQVQHLVSRESPDASNLHAFYGYTLQLLSRRTQSKLHPSLKRLLCKKCLTQILPGTDFVKVRIRGKRACKRMVLTCLNCKAIRRFPIIEKEDKQKANVKQKDQVANDPVSTRSTHEGDGAAMLPPIDGEKTQL